MMAVKTTAIYLFIGSHSLLIGFFPFYLPVFLWKNGISLAGIAAFIAVTGLGFCVALWGWDRIHKRFAFKWIIAASFVLEGLLLSVIFLGDIQQFLVLLALLNGAYNCFFWTTQRVIFLGIIQPGNSGRKFGNLQILAAVLLKTGIFLGGLLLESFGFGTVFVLSILMAALSLLTMALKRALPDTPPELKNQKPISLAKIIRFKDSHHSRPVFMLDGLFLYLESYFWMISLFLVVGEDFWELGLLVIGLMVSFTVLFFLIKNSIDRLPSTRFFRISVGLYAVSWLLRGLITPDLNPIVLGTGLVLITFFSSLFRLSFAKRFFDIALEGSNYAYLIYKSYLSQASIALLFALIAGTLLIAGHAPLSFSPVYLLASMVAIGYFIYGKKSHSGVRLKPIDLKHCSDRHANTYISGLKTESEKS